MSRIVAIVAVAALASGLAFSTKPADVRAYRGERAPNVRLAAHELSWHGGVVTSSTGERLAVYVSDTYPPDVNPVQQWADFFAGLPHGSELGLLTVDVASPAEVQTLCSVEAVGCYATDRLVVAGEMVDGESPQEIARHEYGHHIAANRANSPWPAVDWGPKRWATAEKVCSLATARMAFPGDEGEHYALNPGEAFAETYRVMSDVTAVPGSAIDWPLVDGLFLPNKAALQAAADDVRHPWTGKSTLTVRARFPADDPRIWTATVKTPLDGTLTVEVSAPPGERDVVDLLATPSGPVLARGAASGAWSERLDYLVCGRRAETLRVTRSRDSGRRIAIRITRP